MLVEMSVLAWVFHLPNKPHRQRNQQSCQSFCFRPERWWSPCIYHLRYPFQIGASSRSPESPTLRLIIPTMKSGIPGMGHHLGITNQLLPLGFSNHIFQNPEWVINWVPSRWLTSSSKSSISSSKLFSMELAMHPYFFLSRVDQRRNIQNERDGTITHDGCTCRPGTWMKWSSGFDHDWTLIDDFVDKEAMLLVPLLNHDHQPFFGSSMASSSCSFWWRRIKEWTLLECQSTLGSFHVFDLSLKGFSASTTSSGRVKTCNPTLTIIPSMMASVKGSFKRPGALIHLALHFDIPTGIQSVFHRIHPHPLPEVLVTSVVVVKPGWKIVEKFHISELITFWNQPFRTPASKIFWDHPHLFDPTMTKPSWWDARRVRFLQNPFRFPVLGVSQSRGIAFGWMNQGAMVVRSRFVKFVSAPWISRLIFLSFLTKSLTIRFIGVKIPISIIEPAESDPEVLSPMFHCLPQTAGPFPQDFHRLQQFPHWDASISPGWSQFHQQDSEVCPVCLPEPGWTEQPELLPIFHPPFRSFIWNWFLRWSWRLILFFFFLLQSLALLNPPASGLFFFRWSIIGASASRIICSCALTTWVCPSSGVSILWILSWFPSWKKIRMYPPNHARLITWYSGRAFRDLCLVIRQFTDGGLRTSPTHSVEKIQAGDHCQASKFFLKPKVIRKVCLAFDFYRFFRLWRRSFFLQPQVQTEDLNNFSVLSGSFAWDPHQLHLLIFFDKANDAVVAFSKWQFTGAPTTPERTWSRRDSRWCAYSEVHFASPSLSPLMVCMALKIRSMMDRSSKLDSSSSKKIQFLNQIIRFFRNSSRGSWSGVIFLEFINSIPIFGRLSYEIFATSYIRDRQDLRGCCIPWTERPFFIAFFDKHSSFLKGIEEIQFQLYFLHRHR